MSQTRLSSGASDSMPRARLLRRLLQVGSSVSNAPPPPPLIMGVSFFCCHHFRRLVLLPMHTMHMAVLCLPEQFFDGYFRALVPVTP